MKIVLTVFAPVLIAIAIRLLLFLIGIIIGFVIFVMLQIDVSSEVGNFLEGLFAFETFDWDESWGYWILVIIGSFMAEMVIWQND